MTQTVTLNNWRFLSFLTAQFLGAFNDNAFKLVVSMASLSLITDPAKQQSYLAMTSALAILPFLLFSGYAGYLADRYAKSNVLRISKAAEILAMLAALAIFVTGQNITHLLVTLFLLALHSAFFSPSKYGILPEILSAENLPKANGYLNMLTFVAIILGSLSGATLWGMFKHTPEIIGIILTGIAVLGTLLCLFVPQSPRGNAQKKFTLNPFSEITRGVVYARNNIMMAVCMLGSAMFWLLGGLIYLSLIMLGKTQLGLSEGAAGSLFAFLASGIALGSVIAGYLIGKNPRPTLSFWGGSILSIGCLLTGIYATNYLNTAVLMSVIGLGGGLFVVPLVTLMQKNAPIVLRGQILATSGFFDMLGVFLASGIFWLLGAKAGLSSSAIIMAAGGISLAGLLLALLIMKPQPPSTYDTLGGRFITQCKQRLRALTMSDTTGQRLTGIKSLVAARLLAQWLKPQLPVEEQNVALLIPASVGGALANIALALLGKTSVNLNFSLGLPLMEEALRKVQVRHIITTRKVIAKLGMTEDARMLFMEDGIAKTNATKRFRAFLQAYFYPTALLHRSWLSRVQQSDATATILFSSGSTATPKAVMLSHANIIANIDSVSGLLQQVEARECQPYALAGILPFFHSFGLTVCLWLPAITGRRVAYHSNPLEAKTVVKMIAKEKLQILMTTPTFARHYVTAAKENMLASLRLVILGGEKLVDTVEAQLVQALPDAAILQGYGATELGPVVAINVPGQEQNNGLPMGYRQGSVGKAIPGVSIRIVSPETGEELAHDMQGLVLVQSPSRMQGYYQDEAMTGQALRGDWYITGDIGSLDADGFLFITDRMARFSKIAGEMVPHGKVEEAIEKVIGDKSMATVVAITDNVIGEKLSVLTTETGMSPKEIYEALKQSGLPNIWIPTADAIFAVENLPMLATGKRNIRASQQLAESLMKS